MRKFHGQNNWQVHGPRFLEGCLEGIIDVTRVVCPFGIFNFIIELYFFVYFLESIQSYCFTVDLNASVLGPNF